MNKYRLKSPWRPGDSVLPGYTNLLTRAHLLAVNCGEAEVRQFGLMTDWLMQIIDETMSDSGMELTNDQRQDMVSVMAVMEAVVKNQSATLKTLGETMQQSLSTLNSAHIGNVQLIQHLESEISELKERLNDG
ncbi:hypothetical protein [Ferrimonas balearica]|uniref:hypothetical protein n=1 Tax=Ferrimonas balearica TaxID=44012 RepID=UPI001F3DB552|nr:hypothetical protein [Ferrimonas balearica]MBY6093798.1 hypothetical protein [Ferrimonas balearica]